MSVAHQAGASLPNEQRLGNAASCLRTLRDSDATLTISQLASRTGLSRPTVDAVLRDLADVAPVTNDSRAKATGVGRPARRFGFDPSAGSVAGIDAGRHTLRLTLTDLAGTVLASREAPVTPGSTADEQLDAVTELVERARAESGAGPVRATGVGVPGIIDHDQRLTHSLALPDWVGHPVVDRIGAALGCPVILENDIKLAALAEHRLRDDPPDNVVFLQVGNRISLALIVDGRVLQGSHRIAGELGTLRGMRWTASSERGQLRWRAAETATEVFALAADGNLSAQQEIEEFCAEIAPGIATILLTVDPDLVVVGGGLTRAGEVFLDPLTAAVHHRLTIDARPSLVPALLRSTGPSVGAVGLAFQDLSDAVVGVAGVEPPWWRWRPPDDAALPGRPTDHTVPRPDRSHDHPNRTNTKENR